MKEKIISFINKYIVCLITVIILFCSSNIKLNNDSWKSVLMNDSDGKGYYAYLPAVFIYHDLHFRFFENVGKRKA